MQDPSLADLIRKKFIGSDDLRKKLPEILSKLPEEKEIIITHHGSPKAALLDLDYYLEMQNRLNKSASKETLFSEENKK